VTPTAVRIASGDTAGAVNGEEEKFVSPVQRGLVQNWDQLESILHYLFYDKVRQGRGRGDAGVRQG
jgi:actin-related protein